MNDLEELAAARDVLRAHLEALVGPGPIPRFEEALTHPSYANEVGTRDNQRLEFLGDAVLGLCVSEMLAASHAEADEGQLTRMRSALVNGEALAMWGRRVALGACVQLGKGARLGTEREQTNVLADATEALVAAVYECRGLEGARAFVKDVVGELYEHVETLSVNDPKSALQEKVQAHRLPSPTYRLVEVRGMPQEPVFEIEVMVGDKALARGDGKSKRLGERAAASNAMKIIEDVLPELLRG
jgi:ribonuclease-3